MNGAETLVRTLAGAGIDRCFANPGTTEIHIVAALDKIAEIRCVLGLFEGVLSARQTASRAWMRSPLFEIGRPDLDWVRWGKRMGVPSTLVSSLEHFARMPREGFEGEGPTLIEVPL
jgi:thiamine pyrophosphate-dependent acetolactate synthase large subunit-like protein